MIANSVVTLYPQVLNFTYEIISPLKRKKESDKRNLICEELALKIFLHAVTIHHLRSGSNVTLKAYPDGSHVVDFASILVLTRAVFETYLKLFEIFFEPRTDDEFEYRYAAYQLRGMKTAELSIQNNPSGEGQDMDFVLQVQQRLKDIEGLRNRIRSTDRFKALESNQQKATLAGSLFPNGHKRNLEDLAKEAGFGKKTFQQVYLYLSGYTHGDSLSISQIRDAISDEQKDGYIRLSMMLTMMVLSHLILNYTEKFPEARAVCDTQPANRNLVAILAKQASSMK